MEIDRWQWLSAQVPDVAQFKSNDGQWSIVAMLLAAIAGTLTVIVFLYKSRDSDRNTEIADLKLRTKELEIKSDKCETDRLELHKQMGAMQREIQILKDNR